MPKLPIGDIGTVEIVYDYGVGSGFLNQRLSPVLGQVKFRANDAIADVQEEAYGDASVDGVFKGTVCELEVPMTRSTLAQLAAVLPSSSLSGAALSFKNAVGLDMYANAVAIVLKPIVDNVVSVTPAEWVLIHKCHAYRSIELPFDRSTQRVHLIKFKVFPCQESGLEGEYFQEGVVIAP